MNVNELKDHNRTLIVCLNNSFLKKWIPRYFFAVTHAVTPKGIGLEVSPQCLPFQFHFVNFIRKTKLLCLITSPHKLHPIVKPSFPSTLPV